MIHRRIHRTSHILFTEQRQIPLLSENPTVSKVTRIADERKRGIEEERKSLTSLNEKCRRRTEKSAPQEKTILNFTRTLSQDGPATGGRRTSLAVVAYRDGQLYCIRTMS